jgi:hypothetical protein
MTRCCRECFKLFTARRRVRTCSPSCRRSRAYGRWVMRVVGSVSRVNLATFVARQSLVALIEEATP